MHPIRLLSVTEQTAAHLRQGLKEGRWSGRLPGVVRLATEWNVSTGVVRAALRQLEAEGLLSGRGLGRSRSIAASVARAAAAPLRVTILRHDARLADNPQTSMVLTDIEVPHFFAAVAFCARQGIRVPEHVSLVSTDCDTILDGCHPGFAHMRWDNAPIVRRVVRWVDAVRNGKPDRRAILFPAAFIPGDSIGPAWKG